MTSAAWPAFKSADGTPHSRRGRDVAVSSAAAIGRPASRKWKNLVDQRLAMHDARAAGVRAGDQFDALSMREPDVLGVLVENATEIADRVGVPAGEFRLRPLKVNRRDGRDPGDALLGHAHREFPAS